MVDLARCASSSTLNALFQRAFEIYAESIAVTSEERCWTYREVGDRAGHLSAALYELGVRKGDRVAILSETRPEYVEAYAATASLGAIAMALNIRLHPDELNYCIDSGKPRAILTSGATAQVLDEIRAAASIPHWICFDPCNQRFLHYEDLLSQDSDPPPSIEISGSDIHNILYTSGTTGRPKGAMISQSAAAVRALRIAQWFGLTPRDGFMGWAPMFHCLGDESLYATMLTGGRYATLRKADPEVMFQLIERDRLTWVPLLPGVIDNFLHHPRRSEYDLSSLRFSAGYANMMPQMVKELTATLGIPFWDAYGQTETSYLVAFGMVNPGAEPSMRKDPTSLLDIRLVDSEMSEVEAGVPGECVVRGPSVMSGYYDDTEATEAVFAGGWLHTGDVLVRHEDGTLSFVDRQKYLIKTGGENVYPAEVEQVIAQIDGVQEVCVFSVADERWGEAVKAAIVLRPEACLTAKDIVEWCQSRLSGYKRPRYIQFFSPGEVPRSATGKLQRNLLAAMPVKAQEAV